MFNGHPNAGNLRRRPWKFLLFPLLAAGVVFLAGTAVQYLWNAILPAVTGVRALTFWQAVGLLVLCRLLFGGFRGGSANWRGRHRGGSPRMRERWMQMSEEERARFKEEWRQRCRPRKRGEE